MAKVVDFNKLPNLSGFLKLTPEQAKKIGGIRAFGGEETLDVILFKLGTVAQTWERLKGKAPAGILQEEKSDSDVKSIIKELGDTDWGKDNEAQAKAVQLLKGLAFSDEALSNKFMRALSKASTEIAERLLKDDVIEEGKSKRNLLLEQTDHFLGGDLMEEETSYSKLIKLNKNMEIDVMRARRDNTEDVDENFAKFVIKKFDKPAVMSMSSLESAIKNKQITMYGKKRKDLGANEWTIDLIKNKYIIVALRENRIDNSVSYEYFEVK